MSTSLSPNTQAILLLTAPLIAGRNQPAADLLTPGEYKRLARYLREKQKQPADLLASAPQEVLGESQRVIDSDRLERRPPCAARWKLEARCRESWPTAWNGRP